jgi:hypothetical protein
MSLSVRQLADEIGFLQLQQSAFDQVVSFSEPDKYFSLRQFIASRVPSMMQALRIAAFEAPSEPVARVTELSEARLRNVVKQRLTQEKTDAPFAIMGLGTYTIEELQVQIDEGTAAGVVIVASERRNIDVLETLIERSTVALIPS